MTKKNASVVVAFVLLSALQVLSDLILGIVTDNSILVHSERITDSYSASVKWNGHYNITRIEILDQSLETSGFVLLVDGGLNESYVVVNFEAVGSQIRIDFVVNIYGETWPPNDFIVGELTEFCVLLYNTSIFDESGYTTFHYTGDYNLTRIAALDQSNGAGGYIYWIDGGLGFYHVTLHFNAMLGDRINFVIHIYGHPVEPNHFQQGCNTDTSFVIHSESIIGFGEASFVYSGLYDIVRVEAADQSNGLGGFVSAFYAGVSYRNVILFFESVDNYREINFIVRIYGEPLRPRDFIVGNLTSNSVQLHRAWIWESKSGLARFDWSGQSKITRIEALDQSVGDGGEVYRMSGGLNENYVTLHFESIAPNGLIDFVVNVYGDCSITQKSK